MNPTNKLYLVDARGKMRIWQITELESGIEITHGCVGGQLQTEVETISYGLANRSKQEQIQSRIKSMIKKRIDQGYEMDIDKAQKKNGRGVNQLGLPRPMLATKISEVDVDLSEVYVQNKLDGHRCLISCVNGVATAYSRNGKIIDSIPHITDEIASQCDDVLFDGELYIHGTKLQTITSLVKREQEGSRKLVYYVYDVVSTLPFGMRILQARAYTAGLKNTKVLETTFGASNLNKMMDKAISGGFEGLILRPTGSLYESGKRSKQLIKVKKFYDDEFKVIGIKRSVEGWAILECITPAGVEFSVSAPGTKDEKHHVAENQDGYLGKYVTVEFSMMTKDDVPFHPVAKMWRDIEGE